MRSSFLVLKLVPYCLGIAAIVSAPQASAQTYSEKIFVLPQTQPLGLISLGCPVGITAQQRSMTRQIYTAGAMPKRPGQGLTVAMNDSKSLRIKSAEIAAHALSSRSRAVLTLGEDDADVTLPYTLVAKESGGFRGDLWMEGVTSIRWIEVKSLTYSNGNVWRETDGRKCIVRPDPFMLISSAR